MKTVAAASAGAAAATATGETDSIEVVDGLFNLSIDAGLIGDHELDDAGVIGDLVWHDTSD